MYKFLYHPGPRDLPVSIGVLILRVAVGLMMTAGHGWPMIERLSEEPIQFPDPLGIGAEASLAATVGAEFLCGLAVTVGFMTRWTAAPIIFTMIIASFVVEAGSPWNYRELGILYGVAFLSLAIIGPGRFSMDTYLYDTAESQKTKPSRGARKKSTRTKRAKTSASSSRKSPAKKSRASKKSTTTTKKRTRTASPGRSGVDEDQDDD